jgi:hypothetical protein
VHRRRLRCIEDVRPEGKRQLAFLFLVVEDAKRVFWLFAFQNVSSGWRRRQLARTHSAAVQRLTARVCVRHLMDLSMDFTMGVYTA